MRKIINKFSFPGLLSRILNKSNINKILIIFIVGLTSRIIINYIYNINVFIDYFNKVSIIYYILMSTFIVLVHEVVTYFDVNIIPSCIFDNIKYVMSMNSKVFNYMKLKNIYLYFFTNKLHMTQAYSYDNIKENLSENDLNTKVLTRSTKSISSHNNKNSSHGSNSSTNSDITRTNNVRANNVRANRINNSNGVSNWVINTNNNQNEISSQNNELDRRVYSSDVLFTFDALPSTEASRSASPNRRLYTPDPNSNFTTPSTMTPLFPSSTPSINSQSVNRLESNTPNAMFSHYPVRGTDNPGNTNSTNVDSSYRDSYRLPNTTYVPNNSNSGSISASVSTQPISSTQHVDQKTTPSVDQTTPSLQNVNQTYSSFPNSYELAATYAPISTDSNQVPTTRALINNPRPAQTQSYVTTSNSINWEYYKNQVEDNFHSRGHSSKIVVSEGIVIPDKEIVIPDKGIKGKLKVCFRYLDEKMHSADSIYVTFRDKSKRKFIWNLWESKSGNYESYKDFKESWDPDTSIWSEIKNRTRKDMRADIEAIIGVNRNTRGTLANIRQNRIEPTRTTREVRNLVRDNDPFNNHTSSVNDSARIRNNNAANSSNTEDPERKHKRKHSHSNSSSNHGSNHNHSHRHKRSHSHGKSHNHERRRK
jgi:hypothetical protein